MDDNSRALQEEEVQPKAAENGNPADEIKDNSHEKNESITINGKTEVSDKSEPAKSELKEWIKSIVIAVVIALIIRTFIFEIIQVQGSSMVPTLTNADRVIVVKINYVFNEPERGDIVIFKNPDNPKDHYVKRTIGVADDVVEIKDGIVYVNEKPLEEAYINEKPLRDYPKTKIPKDTLFVLGDNRNRSRDSTDPSVGFIPLKNVLGKAKFRIWPLNNITYFE